MRCLTRVVLLLVLTLFLNACSPDKDLETPSMPEPSPTPNTLPSVTVTPTLAPTPTRSLEGRADADNPYVDYQETRHFWEYYVYEAFRSADRIDITPGLEYHHKFISEDGVRRFDFDLSFPILDAGYIEDDGEHNNLLPLSFLIEDGGMALANGVNMFFEAKYKMLLGMEKDLQEYASEGTGYAYGCNQQVLYSYQWGPFFTFVGTEYLFAGRNFNYPFGDNFEVRTGRHLNLSDLFSVKASDYEPRLRKLIQKIDVPEKPMLNPGYDEGDEEIPLPDRYRHRTAALGDGHFLISPAGIVLFYHVGEIAPNAADTVVLIVPYKEIMDILNPELFDLCLDETGNAILQH